MDCNTKISFSPSYTFVVSEDMHQVHSWSSMCPQTWVEEEGVLLSGKQKVPVVTFKLLLWWKVLIAAIKWAFDPKTIIDFIKIREFAKHSFSGSEEAATEPL